MKKSIDIEGYTLEPELLNHGRFNVWKKTVVASGKNAGKEGRLSLGYAVKLPRAINIIAEDAVWKEDKHIFLNEYVEEKLKMMHKVANDTLLAFIDVLKDQ